MHGGVLRIVSLCAVLSVESIYGSAHSNRVIRSNDIEVTCSPIWNATEQNFNMTVEWMIAQSFSSINAINFFKIYLRQHDVNDVIVSISSQDVYRETDTYSYVDNVIFTPKVYPATGYISINPSYSSQPDTILNHGYCDSPISPPAPSKIKQFEVNSYNVDSEIALNKILVQVHHMNIEWNLSITSDPSVANATSLGYEIWIGSVNNTQDIVSGNVYSLNNITSVNETVYSGCTMNIDEHLQLSLSSENIYIKIRCFYNVTFDVVHSIYSAWSDTRAVSIYSETNTETQSSSSNPQDMTSSIASSMTFTVKSSVFSEVENSPSSTTVETSTTSALITNSPSKSVFVTSAVPTVLVTVMPNGNLTDNNSTVETSTTSPLITNSPSKSFFERDIITILFAILTPLILLILLIATLITVILFARRRKNFQMLSYELDSSVLGHEEDELFFQGRSNTSGLSLSHQNILDTSFDCCDEWEVPAKSVIISERLGEGCFGEVFKGEIMGFMNTHLISYQSRNEKGKLFVAVKVLKTNASNQEKNDFLKEIELMKVIAKGNNPHVVNMIGAITRQEPMCVVTEFLAHGDLLSYLKAARKNMNFTEKQSKQEDNNSGYIQEKQPDSVDLVSFAYQISSGMEYLSSLKIVHRDLACRNILVGTGKLLKVSDFGLSRNINYDNAYVKSSNGPVPVRWMAIESIMYHEFTTASDVWSFGIILWEIGTLGAVPYPNIVNNDILHKLQTGYRIEKPKTISDEIYGVMLKCCSENPTDRPTFSILRRKFDAMLSKHNELYLDLSLNPETNKLSSARTSPMNINNRPLSNVYVDNSAMYSQENTPSNISILDCSTTPTYI